MDQKARARIDFLENCVVAIGGSIERLADMIERIDGRALAIQAALEVSNIVPEGAVEEAMQRFRTQLRVRA